MWYGVHRRIWQKTWRTTGRTSKKRYVINKKESSALAKHSLDNDHSSSFDLARPSKSMSQIKKDGKLLKNLIFKETQKKPPTSNFEVKFSYMLY